jgi:hypothetical protein
MSLGAVGLSHKRKIRLSAISQIWFHACKVHRKMTVLVQGLFRYGPVTGYKIEIRIYRYRIVFGYLSKMVQKRFRIVSYTPMPVALQNQSRIDEGFPWEFQNAPSYARVRNMYSHTHSSLVKQDDTQTPFSTKRYKWDITFWSSFSINDHKMSVLSPTGDKILPFAHFACIVG